MSEIIKTEHLYFEYENPDLEARPSQQHNYALQDINVSIQQGEFVAVLGHNGCGKSTLAKLFNGILVPTSGHVFVDGMNTRDDNRIFDIRQRVGMVFQNPDNQIVATVVEEDVAFALENLGVDPSEIRLRVDDALLSVDMLDYKDHAPHQLSGGQKQRVAIAGIIAMRPECIVLDEPTAMLDPKGRKEVLKTIRKLNKNYNITTILITHYMDEAAKANRVLVMDEGKIVMDATPRQVFSQVETMKALGLDVPQASELAYEIEKLGYAVPKEILHADECVEAISQLLEE